MTVHVLAKEQALVIEADRSLLAHLPSAFELAEGFIAMPHDLDSVIRLTRAGIRVPSPIEHYYSWPRQVTRVPQPFGHQVETAAFCLSNPHCYVLNDIGTGKTLSVLWAADYLMQAGAARRALIAAPLSTLNRVWGDEIFMHFTHRSARVLHGSAEKRRRLLAEPADFYIINHDGVGVIEEALAARPDIDIVILDELSIYRNRGTQKWKVMDRLIYPSKLPPKPWVWGLTGAPIPQSPEDAYGECKLITPTTVPKFFTQWRAMVMDHQSTYVWTPRKEALTIVHKAMQPAIRFKREDCLDLPPTIVQTREVEFSAEQNRLYKSMAKELYVDVAAGRVTAANEGVKLSKLMQIACGCVYDADGRPNEIDPGNRLEILMELIEQIDEKVLVFVPFTAVTAMVARELNKHWNFAVVTGDTSPAERDRIFLEVQDPAKDVDLIAHPGCMAHGINLTSASTIVWYAPMDSNEIYTQANGRPDRAGKKHTLNIVHLAGSAVERRAYRRLADRQALQGMLLSMVEAEEL